MTATLTGAVALPIMNTRVLAVTAILALGCGGWLLFTDWKTRRRIEWLRTNGSQSTATVIGRAVQHRKPVVVCRLADGRQLTVAHRGELTLRTGSAVELRHAALPSGVVDAELVAEPRHSIGRGVGISLAVGIVLLGGVLAAMS